MFTDIFSYLDGRQSIFHKEVEYNGNRTRECKSSNTSYFFLVRGVQLLLCNIPTIEKRDGILISCKLQNLNIESILQEAPTRYRLSTLRVPSAALAYTQKWNESISWYSLYSLSLSRCLVHCSRLHCH